jgi:hypothetical protein
MRGKQRTLWRWIEDGRTRVSKEAFRDVTPSCILEEGSAVLKYTESS